MDCSSSRKVRCVVAILLLPCSHAICGPLHAAPAAPVELNLNGLQIAIDQKSGALLRLSYPDVGTMLEAAARAWRSHRPGVSRTGLRATSLGDAVLGGRRGPRVRPRRRDRLEGARTKPSIQTGGPCRRHCPAAQAQRRTIDPHELHGREPLSHRRAPGPLPRLLRPAAVRR